MVQKTSGEIEKEFIDTLQSSTGKNLSSWLAEIKASGIEKRNDIIGFLKSVHAFGHMHAGLLVGIYINGGKPVYGSTDELLDNQFAKAEEMRPLFEEWLKFVKIHYPNATVLPKKTYVSILEKREFAAINIKRNELRIGFDLGERPFDELIGKSRLTGPMPRISHQFIFTEVSQLNEIVASLLKDSYNRSH